jgi:hypothetical protein
VVGERPLTRNGNPATGTKATVNPDAWEWKLKRQRQRNLQLAREKAAERREAAARKDEQRLQAKFDAMMEKKMAEFEEKKRRGSAP